MSGSTPSDAKDTDPNGDDKIKRYGWIIRNRPPRLLNIPKTDLHVDKSYQRTDQLSLTKIHSIAAAWDWLAFGALTVVERNGKYFVVEGWHRVEAAMRRSDIHKVPCAIFTLDGGVQDEALGFVAANTSRKPVSTYSKWKALVRAGDPTALFIKALIEKEGFVGSPAPGPNHVRCLGALQRICEKEADRAVISRLFPTIAALCRGADLSDRILGGCLFIEQKLPEGISLSDTRWRDRLLKVGRGALLESIASACGFFSAGGQRIWAMGIKEAVNKKLRLKLRVDLGEIDEEAVA